MKKNPFRVILVHPQIPWNTGNIGRTCLGLGADLHLVGPLGFSLEDRYLKRAGLDYWPAVNVQVHPDAKKFFSGLPSRRLFFFSVHARRSLWRTKIPRGAYLVFGSETKGLPDFLRRRCRDRFFKIPVFGTIRSYNLSTAVGMGLSEAVRQSLAR